MATKTLECTIHFAVLAEGVKNWGLIRPKITVLNYYGNSRKRVYKTGGALNIIRPPKWAETVRVETKTSGGGGGGGGVIVFQLTDIFNRKVAQAALPIVNITEAYNTHVPLVSTEGEALGSLVLTLRLVNPTEGEKCLKHWMQLLEQASSMGLCIMGRKFY